MVIQYILCRKFTLTCDHRVLLIKFALRKAFISSFLTFLLPKSTHTNNHKVKTGSTLLINQKQGSLFVGYAICHANRPCPFPTLKDHDIHIWTLFLQTRTTEQTTDGFSRASLLNHIPIKDQASTQNPYI